MKTASNHEVTSRLKGAAWRAFKKSSKTLWHVRLTSDVADGAGREPRGKEELDCRHGDCVLLGRDAGARAARFACEHTKIISYLEKEARSGADAPSIQGFTRTPARPWARPCAGGTVRLNGTVGGEGRHVEGGRRCGGDAAGRLRNPGLSPLDEMLRTGDLRAVTVFQ